METTFKKTIGRLMVVLFLFLSVGCSTDDEDSDDGGTGYQYWTGAIPNSIYGLNIYGERGLNISGKPFMVVKYDKVSLKIIDCQFGLSEVTQAKVTTPSGMAVPPEPTLDAGTIEFNDKLGLKSPVVLLVQWNITGYATKSDITNGVQNFSFRRGNSPGGIGYNEEWIFSYTNSSMIGGVKNLDLRYYMGHDSENNAFNMIPK